MFRGRCPLGRHRIRSDAFIGRRLRAAGLRPAAAAAPATRVRRLYLQLQGLPPTSEELAAATAPGSWDRTIDRALDSEHYGEHMARLWLDVARWAESEGFAENTDWPFAWRYRDYVARSFFRDQSYAMFLRQQISGDEMEPYRNENLVATGFLATARISADDLNCYRQENELYCDLVNATTSAVLGLTMRCARCHDHKFDPISQRDYYRFQAFFVRGMPGNVILAEASRSDELDRVAGELLKLTLQVRRRVLNEGYDLEPPALRQILRLSESQRNLEQERLYRPARVRLNMRVAGCNGFRIQPEEKKRLDELKARLETLGQTGRTDLGILLTRQQSASVECAAHAGEFSAVARPGSPGWKMELPARPGRHLPTGCPARSGLAGGFRPGTRCTLASSSPHGAGRLDDRRLESVDSPRVGQPHLATAFRTRPGLDSREFRYPRREAVASQIARLAGRGIDGARLEHQTHSPLDRDVTDLAAICPIRCRQRSHRRRKPILVEVAGAAPLGRSHSRRHADGQWRVGSARRWSQCAAGATTPQRSAEPVPGATS